MNGCPSQHWPTLPYGYPCGQFQRGRMECTGPRPASVAASWDELLLKLNSGAPRHVKEADGAAIASLLESRGVSPFHASRPGDGLDIFSKDWSVPLDAQLLIVHALRGMSSTEDTADQWSREVKALDAVQLQLLNAASVHARRAALAAEAAKHADVNRASNRRLGLSDSTVLVPVSGISVEAVSLMRMLGTLGGARPLSL
jgi:hypothetical protein